MRFFLLALLLGASISVAAKPSSKNYLIKFKKSVSIRRIGNILKISGNKKRRKRLHEKLRIYRLNKATTFFIGRLLKRYGKFISYIEEDYKVHAIGSVSDPMYADQVGMHRMGVEKAWEMTRGSYDVLVGVSDTGTSPKHPDLAQQMWRNPGEIAGNGIDDDGNGYIDDIFGYDFNARDSDPSDQNSHGTHVSGIIGAVGNNKIGISGVAQKVSIMAVQFLDKKGSGRNSDGIETIIYAADNGARILNCSWGGGGASKALKDALDYAAKKNMLVLAAAGNDGQNNDTTPSFPANYDSSTLLSVAASEDDGLLASFSNYGQTKVDFAAPGYKILSTVLDGRYQRYSGTSMATPMASGVAALMLSYRPKMSAIELKNALLNAVVQKENYRYILSTGGELSASLALKQLSMGFQLMPQVLTLALGSKHQFSAFDAQGPVDFSVSDSSLASINKNGVLSVKDKEGEVIVLAKDSTGVEVQAQVSLVRVQTSDGGGCVSTAQAGEISQNREKSSPLTWASYLLLLFPYLVLRRGIQKLT